MSALLMFMFPFLLSLCVCCVLQMTWAWTGSPPPPRFFGAGRSLLFSRQETGKDGTKPGVVVVVGATGRVGRHVVEQLLEQDKDIQVRAIVRNETKAAQVLPPAEPRLRTFQADLSRYQEYTTVLEEAVAGSSSIISVLGVVRFSKFADWLPWRILSKRADWADTDHPYYGNYLGQLHLLELAEKHNLGRFVRLTGLSITYPPFHPFAILFNTLLSCNNRWGLLTEQAMYKSKVPTLVLRPGGLVDDIRDVTTTHVQVDVTGKLPFPARIGRYDVAALSVAAVTLPQALPSKLVLACRWCGQTDQVKPQGIHDRGYATARECLAAVAQRGYDSPATPSKPYGVAVALTLYGLLFLSYNLSKAFLLIMKRFFLGR